MSVRVFVGGARLTSDEWLGILEAVHDMRVLVQLLDGVHEYCRRRELGKDEKAVHPCLPVPPTATTPQDSNPLAPDYTTADENALPPLPKPSPEEAIDMSSSWKRPARRTAVMTKQTQGSSWFQPPQRESDTSADSSDSRLSFDSQYTEDSTDSSASSTTTGVALVIQLDPLL
ncbi:hypothetical protein MRX96_020235 [Rhipicephalus microplus]